MSEKLGYQFKLYYGSAPMTGTNQGDVTWTEIDKVLDVNLTDSRDALDRTRRASGGVKGYKPGMRDLGIDFDLPADASNEVHNALEAAYLAGTALSIAEMDGDIATEGSTGLTANFHITKFDKARPNAEFSDVKIEMKPTPTAFAAAYTVGSES